MTCRVRSPVCRRGLWLLGAWLVSWAAPARADAGPQGGDQAKPAPAEHAVKPSFGYHPSTGKPMQVRWQPYWPRMQPWEYVLTGSLIGGQLLLELGPIDIEGEPRTRGPWPGDGLARDLLRVDDPDVQGELDGASDYTWHATELFPLYGSALLGALVVHGQPAVAWQLTAISIQSLFVSGVVSRILHATVRRKRPHFDALCPARSRRFEDFCRAREGESQGFISGHAALAFTGAGLTCRFHEELPLFGGGWGDALACTTALSGAFVTGVLRVISDRHYASDTIAGALVGFFNGYFLPKLLHFHDRPASHAESASRLRWLPWLREGGGGVSAMGRW